jgi:nucleoside-diphosphate-sugar epimerase
MHGIHRLDYPAVLKDRYHHLDILQRPIIDYRGAADLAIILTDVVGEPATAANYEYALKLSLANMRLLSDLTAADVPVVFASSASVYGFQQDRMCREDSCLNPLGGYGGNKFVTETFINAHRHIRDNTVVLRFGTVFGHSPAMRYDLCINRMIADGIYKGVVGVGGDGNQVRPFLWVNDIAQAISLIAETGTVEPGVYNLATFNESILNVGKIVSSSVRMILSKPCRVKKTGPVDPRSYVISDRKFRTEVGVTSFPETLASEAIEHTICKIANAQHFDYDVSSKYDSKKYVTEFLSQRRVLSRV